MAILADSFPNALRAAKATEVGWDTDPAYQLSTQDLFQNAENQLAQEEEMQKVVKTALEQSSHNPKALKNPSHNLFSQTMKGI